MIITGFEDELTRENLDPFDHGRYEEIVQMLADLGYLQIADQEGEIVSAATLHNAVKSFRIEGLLDGFLTRDDILYSFPKQPKDKPNKILSQQEISLLQLLVNLDGEFIIKRLPALGSQSIFTRVFHYRLSLLGLYAHPVEDPFSDLSVAAWNQLIHYLGPTHRDRAFQSFGDLQKLIYLIKDCPRLNHRIVYYTFAKGDMNTKSFDLRSGPNKKSFTRQLGKDIDQKSKEFKNFKNQALAKSPDLDFLAAKVQDPENKFLLRIVQLYQWTSGYYLGTIDGDIGGISFESFLELVAGEVEAGNIEIQANLITGHLIDDYWVANVHYLLDQMKAPEDHDINYERVFESYSAEFENLDEQQKQNLDTNLKEAWKGINKQFSNNFKSRRYRFRRIYFGVKNLLISVWKGIKNFVKRLASKVFEFVDHLFNKIKNFAKLLYREIREALILFGKGMGFLFGKREYRTESLFSNFDFDVDCFNHNSGIPDNQLMYKNHEFLLRETVGALNSSLIFTARLFKIIMLVQGIGWYRFLIKAGIAFKNFIQQKALKSMI